MANKEQVKILKQGVEVWNQWREAHPGVKIDLRGMNLCEAELCGANLRNVNLRGANLSKTNLREADLFQADLIGANLDEADLSGAILYGVHLSNARLSLAILRKAVLIGAHLNDARLDHADLSEADLSQANLSRTNLHGACLQKANLRFAQLSLATLTNATLTGAYLYGTARDDWKIEDIRCDYVLWEDKPAFLAENKITQAQQWEAMHRTPKDRDFRPSEFEELYRQLPTFEYVFEHGFTPFDPLIMDRVVQAINERQPEIELRLDGFQSRGQPHAVFTVLHKSDIEPAQQQIKADYEARLAALEGKQELLMQLFERVSLGAHINSIEGNVVIQQVQGDVVGNVSGRDYVETVQDHAQVYTGPRASEAKQDDTL